jgi:hypothetical protein
MIELLSRHLCGISPDAHPQLNLLTSEMSVTEPDQRSRLLSPSSSRPHLLAATFLPASVSSVPIRNQVFPGVGLRWRFLVVCANVRTPGRYSYGNRGANQSGNREPRVTRSDAMLYHNTRACGQSRAAGPASMGKRFVSSWNIHEESRSRPAQLVWVPVTTWPAT